MHKGRLEAFSDGVIAIIITIMVLDMKAPPSDNLHALAAVAPAFLSYVLSFLYVGIYWNNHHHLFQIAERVSGAALWANLHLLFWLSLIPFVTRWMGESHFGTWPVAAYGIVLLMAAIAWDIVRRTLISVHGESSGLAKAFARNAKECVSLILYAVAVAVSFVNTWAAAALYTFVAMIWIIPDRRAEGAKSGRTQ